MNLLSEMIESYPRHYDSNKVNETSETSPYDKILDTLFSEEDIPKHGSSSTSCEDDYTSIQTIEELDTLLFYNSSIGGDEGSTKSCVGSPLLLDLYKVLNIGKKRRFH
jgi:hypothetical protein